MLALMYDNLEVAFFEGENSITILRLKSDLPRSMIPFDLFGNKEVVDLVAITTWLENRVFPSHRTGVDHLLKKLGLQKYDVLEIARKTRASLIEDPYWIKVAPDDTFRKTTIRGNFDYPETTYEAQPKAHPLDVIDFSEEALNRCLKTI